MNNIQNNIYQIPYGNSNKKEVKYSVNNNVYSTKWWRLLNHNHILARENNKTYNIREL